MRWESITFPVGADATVVAFCDVEGGEVDCDFDANEDCDDFDANEDSDDCSAIFVCDKTGVGLIIVLCGNSLQTSLSLKSFSSGGGDGESRDSMIDLYLN